MSYEMVVEQVRAMPEQFLPSVSAFIKLLEMEMNPKAKKQDKSNFFALAGKIHLDKADVEQFREASII